MPETREVDTTDILKPEAIEALRQNEAEARRLRSELNELGIQLCRDSGDHSSQVHEISEAIRVLDAMLDNPLIVMQHRTLFSENYNEEVKIGKRRLMLNSVLAMETQFVDGLRERVRKTYGVLHVIFSAVQRKRKKPTLNGHFGWMFLNLTEKALQAMDEGHNVGRLWDANDMDGLARKVASKQKLDSNGNCSATLIWSRKRTHGFEDEPHHLENLSEATIQMQPDKIMRPICGLMCGTTPQSSSRNRPSSS